VSHNLHFEPLKKYLIKLKFASRRGFRIALSKSPSHSIFLLIENEIAENVSSRPAQTIAAAFASPGEWR
jgi:hypothetical protein